MSCYVTAAVLYQRVKLACAKPVKQSCQSIHLREYFNFVRPENPPRMRANRKHGQTVLLR